MSDLTLLYAEDDQETLENYLLLLRGMFREIYTAANGKKALELYQTKTPDILLVDVSMPVMNGIDLIKEVRKHDKETPIIVLTAHAERDTLLVAVGLKLETYLLKPVDPAELLKVIGDIGAALEKERRLSIRNVFSWDKKTHTLYYKEVPVKLTKKETLLLQALLEDPDQYISNEQIIYRVWSDDLPDHTYDKKLIQLVYRLNKKIAELTGEQTPPFVENSYTRGYRLVIQA
jgi:DNA-binding response OmpR family regulator